MPQGIAQHGTYCLARTVFRWSAVVAVCLAALTFASPSSAQATLIQRGEYLARAGDCVSCHTAPGGAPFAGGLRLDTPFGYMLAPNITPDAETGIGRWSDADFYRALHDGVNKHGQDMYPTMPYDFYTRASREDVDAIYAYLRTVKPVRNEVQVNHLHFPFDQRWSMAAWRELYFTEGTYKPDPSRSASWNRGAYLVEGFGHCSDCHSPRNLLGGIEKSKDFNGAVIDGWFALDLTSDIATGLGTWTADEIATYLKTGTYKDRTTALGPMAEVIRNSLSFLVADDLRAMAEYLKSIPPESRLRTGRRAPDPTRTRGAKLYTDNCSGCHQAMGRGLPGVFPPLAGNGVVVAADPGNILKVIDGGIPARGAYIPMPGFKDKLTDQQVAEVANYIRTSWGNGAAPNATPEGVARMRAAKN
ncbi:MAG TPA: c-type cytochrome [Casimicrobiaceae bacterium]|nr:c-type cytochrome [Casimicrobiaceae bacterium]